MRYFYNIGIPGNSKFFIIIIEPAKRLIEKIFIVISDVIRSHSHFPVVHQSYINSRLSTAKNIAFPRYFYSSVACATVFLIHATGAN